MLPFRGVTFPDELMLGYVPELDVFTITFVVGESRETYAVNEKSLAGMCEAFASFVKSGEVSERDRKARKSCASCN